MKRWKDYARNFKMKKGVPIVKIKSDRGKEFENAKFEAFCNKHGIKKEFSAQRLHNKIGLLKGRTG